MYNTSPLPPANSPKLMRATRSFKQDGILLRILQSQQKRKSIDFAKGILINKAVSTIIPTSTT
ncbi:hypothetical protein SADUNF_Sadunf14G0041100 [Salix dunnii]|uniref:Uncharacterized protein n=1 Tax=Salix dunnii TaxID=1413687 RepID=A0A835JG52_9ROSI|nr:hypothetical protein SADUNF_Sadunf14G0041100 [Salix dunnii]